MKKAAVAGNQATGLLKLLALLFMCCDHAGKILAPGVLEWRMLGRLALPLYAWCLVVGACYTRSMGKYRCGWWRWGPSPSRCICGR